MLAVKRGFDRLANFRAARLHFLRQYTGPYYDSNAGNVGDEALNMVFNAIRVLLPTMVMNFPRTIIMTPYLASREYATLLGLALDQNDKKINICNEYRASIVDAIFTLGILKTGLCQSDSVYAMDDMEGHVDAGTVYTKKVDFDNWVVDPNSREHMFVDASFMGDRITVPRRVLLDSGLYDNDLVERLPRAGQETHRDKRAYNLSMRNIEESENSALEDDVEIVELWVPDANAMVTIPGSEDMDYDEYLRVEDYYGVKEGPYSLLALTPPVPGNCLPVPMVGIWSDLHELSNRMAKKIVEQAQRQKDVYAYKRSAADDAEEIRNASDGEGVAVDDPSAVEIMRLGGQENSNENHLSSLQAWFNMMAGNPEQVGGQRVDAKSATAANILQQNASVSLEDMKDMVYKFAADEKRRRAWYFHTDPLMNIPLAKRHVTPGGMQMDPMTGAQFLQPPTIQEVQVILTPEIRSGDYIDFTFEIEPESMGRIDSKVRLQQEYDLAQKILPAAAAAAQICMGLGVPFSFQAFVLRMAKDAGIQWMDEVFYDPQFQQQQQQMQMMGPQMQDSKGQAGPPKPNMMNQILQNGQPASVMGGQPSPGQQVNQNAQAGAEDAQRMVKAGMTRAFVAGPTPKPPFANSNAF
jgi:hypothetical protein